MCKYPSREYFIQEYLVNKKTREQLAKENGVSVATIKTHLYEKRVVIPPLIAENELRRMYIDEKKTMKEIAKELGHDRDSVARAIKAYGIERENHYVQYDDTLDDEWISLYLDEGLSTFEIAKRFNCSHGTVKKHLRRCGIDIRDMSDAQRISHNLDVLPCDVQDYDTMHALYVDQHLSLKELGAKYNCAPHAIRKRLTKLGINIRSISEDMMGKYVGDKHPNWKGGITSLDMRLREYFETNLAPLCRKRDHFKCRMCGSKRNLHCHHIVKFSAIVNNLVQQHPELDPVENVNELYDIIVHDPDFLSIDNLVTLCKDCHLYKAHGYKKTISSQAS